jgi:hypothetical protein
MFLVGVAIELASTPFGNSDPVYVIMMKRRERSGFMHRLRQGNATVAVAVFGPATSANAAIHTHIMLLFAFKNRCG